MIVKITYHITNCFSFYNILLFFSCMILKLMNLSFFEEIANTKRDMSELVPEEDKMATIPSLLSLRFCK